MHGRTLVVIDSRAVSSSEGTVGRQVTFPYSLRLAKGLGPLLDYDIYGDYLSSLLMETPGPIRGEVRVEVTLQDVSDERDRLEALWDSGGQMAPADRTFEMIYSHPDDESGGEEDEEGDDPEGMVRDVLPFVLLAGKLYIGEGYIDLTDLDRDPFEWDVDAEWVQEEISSPADEDGDESESEPRGMERGVTADRKQRFLWLCDAGLSANDTWSDILEAGEYGVICEVAWRFYTGSLGSGDSRALAGKQSMTLDSSRLPQTGSEYMGLDYVALVDAVLASQ